MSFYRPVQKPDIYWTKDGRLILRGKAFQDMKRELSGLAKGRCEKCGKYIGMNGDPHHVNGRGAGKRDDRIFVDGRRILQWLCKGGQGCHRKEHVPDKVVPAKPTQEEFRKMLGLPA